MTLGVLALATFAVCDNSLIIGPLVVELSRALGVGVAEVGQFVAGYALPAAAVALLSGPLLDRYGRRRILVGGPAPVALATLGCALVHEFGVIWCRWRGLSLHREHPGFVLQLCVGAP